MEKSYWMWGLFLGLIVVLLVLDLGIFHKKEREMTIKESIGMSTFYIVIALLFGGWIWYQLGMQSGLEYLTAFLVEKSLSLDNIFVISLIFSFFAVPLKSQHRVLFWGILGVLILRAIMISLGAHLVSRFSWVLYLFSLFLIITGIKMFFSSDETPDLENNRLLKWMRTHLRVTEVFHGRKFLVKQVDPKVGRKRFYLTPLGVALILVEAADLIFAVDSVPAVFTITRDPYIVYTSNVFAILGLRALYFCLAVMIHRFYYLKYSLSAVLVFIGSKMFVADLLGLEKFPALVSLGVTFSLIAGGILYSLYRSGKKLSHK